MLRDHMTWAHRKADLFQQKDVQHHKCNYNKHSKAVSLRMGDMVLVCVTNFKGRHKILSRWENREYWQSSSPSKLGSICGMSHKLGRVQPYSTSKFPVTINHNLKQE